MHDLVTKLTQLNAKLFNIVGAGADVGVEESIVDYKLVTADSLATVWPKFVIWSKLSYIILVKFGQFLWQKHTTWVRCAFRNAF